jgi:50S ribosomal subunit-associated GTPase HflX
MNKADLAEHGANRNGAHDAVSISALKKAGLDDLLGAIESHLGGSREEISVTLPARRGDLVAMARRDGEVLSEEYRDGVVSMRARVSASVAGRLRKAADAAI